MPPTQLRHRAKGYQKITAGSVETSILETPPSPTSCDSTTVPTVWCVFCASELKITTQRRCKESNMLRTGKSIRARTTGRVLSREGQDRTSTAQTEQAELVRYFTRFTALCYLRDSRATQTPKLVPTQTSQRIANAVSRSRSNREKLPVFSLSEREARPWFRTQAAPRSTAISTLPNDGAKNRTCTGRAKA